MLGIFSRKRIVLFEVYARRIEKGVFVERVFSEHLYDIEATSEAEAIRLTGRSDTYALLKVSDVRR